MFLKPGVHPQWLFTGDSDQERPPLSGEWYYPSPPPRVLEAVGVAPEGTAPSILSLNWGGWDHTQVQSSHHKGTVRLEVETFNFLVQTATPIPSQLPSWYSSGIPAGAILHMVISLHSEGIRVEP